jgi:hypothetical protein
VLIGVGAGLVLDEFALILTLDDVYWAKEGRISVEIVALAAASLGIFLVFGSPFTPARPTAATSSRSSSAIALHLLCVFITFRKGKLRTAIVGFFLPDRRHRRRDPPGPAPARAGPSASTRRRRRPGDGAGGEVRRPLGAGGQLVRRHVGRLGQRLGAGGDATLTVSRPGSLALAQERRALAEHGQRLLQGHQLGGLPRSCRACSAVRLAAASSRLEPLVLGLQLHHPADALEVHARLGELGDAPQRLDVGVAVAPVCHPACAPAGRGPAAREMRMVWGCIPASSAATEIT